MARIFILLRFILLLNHVWDTHIRVLLIFLNLKKLVLMNFLTGTDEHSNTKAAEKKG